jgi:sterol 24-C-methyltransferase
MNYFSHYEDIICTNKKLFSIVFLLIVLFLLIVFFYFKYKEKIEAFMRLYYKTPKEVENYINSYEQLYSSIGENIEFNDIDDWNNKVPFKGYKPSERAEGTEELYKVLHDGIILGDMDKMYVPPFLGKTTDIIENQLLIEKKMADYLDVKPNDTLLELGCGSGAIAMNMHKNTKCNIIGINIDEDTLEKGRKKLKKNGNTHIILKYQDFNQQLDFPDNSIDGIYEIQACTFTEDMHSLMKELYRVLKPGKRVVMLDGVVLDNFKKNNAFDFEKMLSIRGITAGGGLWHPNYWDKAAKDAGFNIIASTCGDKYKHHYSSELPVLKDICKYFWNIKDWMRFLCSWGILPKHLSIIFDRITQSAGNMIELEEQDKFTTDYLFVWEKPQVSESK